MKRIVIIVGLCVALLVVATCGCLTSTTHTSPTTPTTSRIQVTPTPLPSQTPTTPTSQLTITPTPTSTPQTYTVSVSGPVDTQYGITWTATVYLNGAPIPCSQLTGQIVWYINGVREPNDAQDRYGIDNPSAYTKCTMTHDANGLAGSPFQHTNVITASYNGVTSPPTYYTDNEISTPTPIVTAVPTPTPTATPIATRTPIRIV